MRHSVKDSFAVPQSGTFFKIQFVLNLEGALRVLTAYCTKHGLVQCGGKGGAEGGVAKRIIQQEQNAAQRYGAIRNERDAVMVVLPINIMVQNIATSPSENLGNMTDNCC